MLNACKKIERRFTFVKPIKIEPAVDSLGKDVLIAQQLVFDKGTWHNLKFNIKKDPTWKRYRESIKQIEAKKEEKKSKSHPKVNAAKKSFEIPKGKVFIIPKSKRTDGEIQIPFSSLSIGTMRQKAAVDAAKEDFVKTVADQHRLELHYRRFHRQVDQHGVMMPMRKVGKVKDGVYLNVPTQLRKRSHDQCVTDQKMHVSCLLGIHQSFKTGDPKKIAKTFDDIKSELLVTNCEEDRRNRKKQKLDPKVSLLVSNGPLIHPRFRKKKEKAPVFHF